MRFTRPLAVAIVCVLVTLAPIAVLANHSQEAVAVQHSTASDFSSAKSLDNMTIQGTGSAASIELAHLFDDGLEDGDISEWSGETGDYVVQSATVHSGSSALQFDDSAQSTSVARIDRSVPAESYGSASIWINDTDISTGDTPVIRIESSSNIVIQLAIDSDGSGERLSGTNAGSVIWQDGTGWADTGVDISGANAWNELNVTAIDYGNNQFDLEVYDEAGTLQGSASGLAFRDNAAQIDTVAIRGDDGEGDNFFDDISLGALADEGTYVSSNVSIEDPTKAKANISTISNADAIVSVDEFSSGTWSQVAQSTFTTTGNKSLDISSGTATKYRMNVTVRNQSANGQPSFVLGDDSWLFSAAAPTVDNTTASPTGDITSAGPTLSIQVNDSDFPLAQGDSVTAEFFVDGSSVGSDTLTSNGTASVTTSGLTGGSHTWNVTVTDSFGLSHESDDFTINVPDELRIENESSPGSLITGANVELRFYFEDNSPMIVERTDSDNDGKIDMTGLPADQPFVVVARADGYVSRRIFVPSLYETQTVYLLNETFAHNEIIFELVDYSGLFPKENTVLEIERGLSGSWETVEGDYFGATGQFATNLRDGYRHRLVIRNIETGTERELGTFTPITAGTHTVQVNPDGTISLLRPSAAISYDRELASLPAKSGAGLSITIANVSEDLQSYQVNITQINGSDLTDRTEIFNTAGTSPTGETIEPSLDLSGGAGDLLDVNVTYTTTTGTTTFQNRTFRIVEYLPNEYSIVNGVDQIEQEIPAGNWDAFSTLASLVASLLVVAVVGSKFRVSTEFLGIVALLSMTGFVVVGWLDLGILIVGSAGYMAFAGLRRGV